MFKRNSKLIAVFCLFLISCASEEKYKEKVNTWVGQSVDKLLAYWGEPELIEKAKNGGELYRYNDHRTRESLSVNDAPPQIDPLHLSADEAGGTTAAKSPAAHSRNKTAALDSHSSEDPCLTYFHVSSGKVDTVSFGGTGCKSR